MVELISSSNLGVLEEISDLLVEIGEELSARRVIRHYETESFHGANGSLEEAHAVFFNSRHDRSVSVWVTDFIGSSRSDGIGCKVQLWGKPSTGKPDAHHSVRLSKQIPVTLCPDKISAAIRELLTLETPTVVS
jgi:hypothetical protein